MKQTEYNSRWIGLLALSGGLNEVEGFTSPLIYLQASVSQALFHHQRSVVFVAHIRAAFFF